MITSALISLLGWLVLGISFILPEGSFLPDNFADVISDLMAYVWGWDWIIPVSTLIAVLSGIIILTVAELAWNSGKYLIRLFRGN